MEHLKFPVGRFEYSGVYNSEEMALWIRTIKTFPIQMKELTLDLNQSQKDTPYRPDGWMLKQVVHHCADSHMNALIRFKLALTEETPEIRPYYEARWAELSDDMSDDLESSISLLKGLHHKWGILLDAMQSDDFEKSYYHPEAKENVSLVEATAQYAWHCRHHLGHVKLALKNHSVSFES